MRIGILGKHQGMAITISKIANLTLEEVWKKASRMEGLTALREYLENVIPWHGDSWKAKYPDVEETRRCCGIVVPKREWEGILHDMDIQGRMVSSSGTAYYERGISEKGYVQITTTMFDNWAAREATFHFSLLYSDPNHGTKVLSGDLHRLYEEVGETLRLRLLRKEIAEASGRLGI